jgi:hypothetical protein
MMKVVVYLNGRAIAQAEALNVSQLAAVSDYSCSAHETASEFTPEWSAGSFRIEGHDREQSCWALVQRMAEHICKVAPRGAAGDRA